MICRTAQVTASAGLPAPTRLAGTGTVGSRRDSTFAPHARAGDLRGRAALAHLRSHG